MRLTVDGVETGVTYGEMMRDLWAALARDGITPAMFGGAA